MSSSSHPRNARQIENPLPFLAEAADAAMKYMSLQREHLIISADIRVKREGKRLILGAAALMSAHITLLFFFGWITFELHEAGMPAWSLALICLALFGGVTAVLTRLTLQIGKTPEVPASTSLDIPKADSQRTVERQIA